METDQINQVDQVVDQTIHEQPGHGHRARNIVFVVIICLLAGGLAYGGWWGYDKYITNKPEMVLKKALSSMRDVKSLSFEAKLDMSIGSDDTGSGSDSLDLFGSFLEDTPTQIILDAVGDVDRMDLENPKTRVNVAIYAGSELGTAEADFVSMNKELYFRINDVPLVLSMFLDTDNIKNQWIHYSLGKSDRFFDDDEGASEDDDFEDVILKEGYKALEVKEDYGIEELDGVKVYHFKVGYNKEELILLAQKINETKSNKDVINDALSDMDDEDWDEIADDDYEVWIEKKNYYLRKLEMTSESEEGAEFKYDIVFKVELSNFNKELNIEEPVDAIEVEDFLGSFLKGSMFEDLLEFGQTGEIRKKSDDARRVSDIKMLQTALELYFVDQNSYPIVAEKRTVGSGDFDVLCDQGFQADNTGCGTVYMSIVPIDPSEGEYVYEYKSVDGVRYTLDFVLEVGAGNLKAGLLQATPNGIEQMTEIDIDDPYGLPIGSFHDAAVRSRDAKRVSDIKQLQTAFELYFVDQNAYPESNGRMIVGADGKGVLCNLGFKEKSADCSVSYVYMGKVPVNPTPGGSSYYYERKDKNHYEIYFSLEGDVGGLKKGSLLATEMGIQSYVNDDKLDTDVDNLTDNDEIFIWKTDPYVADTDGDSYLDGIEIENGYDPLIAGNAKLEDR
jgi:hypothetical protein